MTQIPELAQVAQTAIFPPIQYPTEKPYGMSLEGYSKHML
jgi:hypothetical protein